MATSMAVFSSLPNPKTPTSFPKIRFPVTNKRSINYFRPPNPISTTSPSPSSCSCTPFFVSNSLTVEINDEELGSKSGCRIRVKLPIKVHHVPKLPDLDLKGRIGVFREYVGIYKGKRISPSFPYRVEFVADEVSGRDGKPVKFVAHLRDDEFEFIE